MDNTITDGIKEVFNNMTLQLIGFALIITAAYVISYLILRTLKVPTVITKPISVVVMLFTMYYSFKEIFLV